MTALSEFNAGAHPPSSGGHTCTGRKFFSELRQKDRDTTRSEYDGTHGSARVRSVDGSIQFQSAGLNLVLLTPLWTRTAHVVPLRMVRCRFPKLGYG
jgi:hypothetical protein